MELQEAIHRVQQINALVALAAEPSRFEEQACQLAEQWDEADMVKNGDVRGSSDRSDRADGLQHAGARPPG